MALMFLDVANENEEVSEWKGAKYAYIILDYKNPDRDIIKFEEKSFIRYNWKGIYAPKNILDVPPLLRGYFGEQKIETAVIRTHGNVDKTHFIDHDTNTTRVEETDSVMWSDNNANVTISGADLESYPENSKANHIKALLEIADQIKDGGNLVIASCRTGKITRFIRAFYNLTGGRINVYALIKRSNFPFNSKTINGKEVNDGVAIIKGERVFSNVSLIAAGENYPKPVAYLISANSINKEPTELDDIKLNKDGVKVIYRVRNLIRLLDTPSTAN